MWQCCQKKIKNMIPTAGFQPPLKKLSRKMYYKGIKRGTTPVENFPKIFTNVNQ